MNQELLISLEKQAEKHTLDIPCPLDDADYTALFNEQLVKLVVQECASKVTRNEALNIFEHFGVEE